MLGIQQIPAFIGLTSQKVETEVFLKEHPTQVLLDCGQYLRKGRPGQEEYGGCDLMEEDLNLVWELVKKVSWGKASKGRKQLAHPKAVRQRGTWPCLNIQGTRWWAACPKQYG